MIVAIWLGCISLCLAHTFNDTLWLVVLLSSISAISFVTAQGLYEDTIKRIEKLERK